MSVKGRLTTGRSIPGVTRGKSYQVETFFAMSQRHLHYSMVIEWSDENRAYLVILPEWANSVLMPATHGSTYSEAVQHGLVH